jgi:hypothetical protein
MTDPKAPSASADWTKLLVDPDLVSHLGELLQTYRDAAPENREQALLSAMQNIKKRAAEEHKPEKGTPPAPAQPVTQAMAAAAVAPAPEPPPFEPDIFTPSWGQDRRKYPRMRCFVAVELHVEGSSSPIWGNLANTSMGGCFVESVTPVNPGANVEIGLWVSSGKIWVKGVALSGVVTKSAPTYGIRVKFSNLEAGERETLKQFLKYVENSTKGYQAQHGYLAQMKR